MNIHKYADERCDECMTEQIKAKLFPLRQPPKRRATRPFEMIHMNLLSGPEEMLNSYYKYLLVIIDDYTRYLWVYGLRSKHIEAV
jgi:hypothetical protein